MARKSALAMHSARQILLHLLYFPQLRDSNTISEHLGCRKFANKRLKMNIMFSSMNPQYSKKLSITDFFFLLFFSLLDKRKAGCAGFVAGSQGSTNNGGQSKFRKAHHFCTALYLYTHNTQSTAVQPSNAPRPGARRLAAFLILGKGKPDNEERIDKCSSVSQEMQKGLEKRGRGLGNCSSTD